MATPAEEIRVGQRLVRVSNPDKPYFPERGLTKRDVVDYFLSVGDGILRALRNRPTMLERWPRGVFEGATIGTRQDNRGDAFYQKRVPAGAPDWVGTAHITFPSGRTADEVAPGELAVVAWAANLGTLRFHPWPVTKDDVERPDQLRIDLDPMPGVDFAQVVPVAHEVRAFLDELGLVGHPKTTGGRGLHVYLSIEPRWSFGDCRRAVLALGREMQRRRPDLVTTTWWRDQRDRPVFVDYNQMARDHTMTSAYSIRPTPAALVSAPLDWSELDDARPTDFDVTTMPARFAERGDPHAGLDDRRFSLEPLLELADRAGLAAPPER
ncbi:DNA ligase D, polymerase domain-containing protein [Micromonospora nigra]|uniref:DNA ligase D, polymerase domain-containing protein n=1 Tax=Micromonospora nigra TaxID=145857 RepID=A0A1C6T129_9ACTN|nr:DNA primase small subunit domain-containing protein [Micromonospora nigra]SCL35332.1 DNA ligase D, polymerase domain-containing protein [Micromonospora nigra]